MIDKGKFIVSLTLLFESKCKTYTKATVDSWYELLKDFDGDKLFPAMKKLMYSKDDFMSVGKVVAEMKADTQSSQSALDEQAWLQVWESAIRNGERPISARAAKALNSLGGMEWVKNSDPEKVVWTRKEIMQVYINTPEPEDSEFRCLGLNARILPSSKEAYENQERMLTSGTESGEA